MILTPHLNFLESLPLIVPRKQDPILLDLFLEPRPDHLLRPLQPDTKRRLHILKFVRQIHDGLFQPQDLSCIASIGRFCSDGMLRCRFFLRLLEPRFKICGTPLHLYDLVMQM